MKDRYDNELTTNAPALENYSTGIDLYLAAQPGAIEQLRLAIAEDDNFAVAYADLARVLQVYDQPKEAQQLIAHAVELSHGLSNGERAHVEIMRLLLGGAGADAYKLIQEHVAHYPRDVMAVLPCCGVYGLIGFSGRVGREAENLAFMTMLERHYGKDWWFDSQFAFALLEVGQLDRAEPLIERAYKAKPSNANAVHHLAHWYYEQGEAQVGAVMLDEWKKSYDRSGLLHSHLAWHGALWALEANDIDRMLAILDADILPEVTESPAIVVLPDLVSLLLRSELAGHPCQLALWQIASNYAAQHFAKPSISFVDMHTAIAHAFVGTDTLLELLVDNPKGYASDLVAQVAKAARSFVKADWPGMIEHLAPIMPVHERLGGSRAQRDLLELVMQYALCALDQRTIADQFLLMRRPLLRSH